MFKNSLILKVSLIFIVLGLVLFAAIGWYGVLKNFSPLRQQISFAGKDDVVAKFRVQDNGPYIVLIKVLRNTINEEQFPEHIYVPGKLTISSGTSKLEVKEFDRLPAVSWGETVGYYLDAFDAQSGVKYTLEIETRQGYYPFADKECYITIENKGDAFKTYLFFSTIARYVGSIILGLGLVLLFSSFIFRRS